MKVIHLTSNGSAEEKVRLMFRMYDKDNSGEIDLDEMVEIFCLMYSIQVSLSSSPTS